MNTLVNKQTILVLEAQMTYESLLQDNVIERVYSSFDGRIYARLNHEQKAVVLTAISFDKVKVCGSIREAAKFLILESIRQKKNWKKPGEL